MNANLIVILSVQIRKECSNLAIQQSLLETNTASWRAHYWSLESIILVPGEHITGTWRAYYCSLESIILGPGEHITGPTG